MEKPESKVLEGVNKEGNHRVKLFRGDRPLLFLLLLLLKRKKKNRTTQRVYLCQNVQISPPGHTLVVSVAAVLSGSVHCCHRGKRSIVFLFVCFFVFFFVFF